MIPILCAVPCFVAVLTIVSPALVAMAPCNNKALGQASHMYPFYLFQPVMNVL